MRAKVREAHNAESINDCIHKMGIAQKETSEVIYRLELLKETGYLNQKGFDWSQHVSSSYAL